MKKFILLAATLLALLLGILVIRAVALTEPDLGEVEPAADFSLDVDLAAARLAGSLRYRTISFQDLSLTESTQFTDLHNYFAETYPNIHSTLNRETVNDLSLLYTWQGSEPELEPIVLMGHIDVVPVIPGTETDWENPPFAGQIRDGFIWGRGAMDDKAGVVSILEAIEILVGEGFIPRRTIYLAFGHDEEVGGPQGAVAIARLLEERVAGPLALVLDEGGSISSGVLADVSGYVATIGIAEKGFVSFELKIEGEGGHSSRPPNHTNIGILAEAITRLEANQFPTRLDGASRALVENVAPRMPFSRKLLIANLWLFGSSVEKMLVTSPTSAPTVRTTTAVTMFNAGVKDNVLPISASAVVNFRILPGESVASVRNHIVEVVDDDRIKIKPVSVENDPSPVSDYSSAPFQMISNTIHQVFPDDILVTPYLVLGGTDARHYSERSDNVFRFNPVYMTADDLGRAHGTNERMSLVNLERNIQYFYQLIRNMQNL